MSEIKTFRLVTGEDIIAKCNFNDELNSIVIENPVQVTIMPGRTQNAPSFGFIPFPMSSNTKTLEIKLEHVVFITVPAPEFLEQYSQLFGEILTPKSSILI
jgi:hypothetical protein